MRRIEPPFLASPPSGVATFHGSLGGTLNISAALTDLSHPCRRDTQSKYQGKPTRQSLFVCPVAQLGSPNLTFLRTQSHLFRRKRWYAAQMPHKQRMQLNPVRGLDWRRATSDPMNEIFGIVISILVLAFSVFAGLNKSHENQSDR